MLPRTGHFAREGDGGEPRPERAVGNGGGGSVCYNYDRCRQCSVQCSAVFGALATHKYDLLLVNLQPTAY